MYVGLEVKGFRTALNTAHETKGPAPNLGFDLIFLFAGGFFLFETRLSSHEAAEGPAEVEDVQRLSVNSPATPSCACCMSIPAHRYALERDQINSAHEDGC